MKLLHFGKEGGKESTVWGFWLVEIKSLFSLALLKFVGNSRDAFHSHAFNSVSWVLKGQLEENFLDGKGHYINASWKPVLTRRETVHKVNSIGTTWVLTFRGPWADTWTEWRPVENRLVTLTHGRLEV